MQQRKTNDPFQIHKHTLTHTHTHTHTHTLSLSLSLSLTTEQEISAEERRSNAIDENLLH